MHLVRSKGFIPHTRQSWAVPFYTPPKGLTPLLYPLLRHRRKIFHLIERGRSI